MANKGPYKGAASTRPPAGGGGVTQPPQGRQIDAGLVITRYRENLAAVQQELFVTQASLEASEQETAALRQRLAELEQDSEEPEPAEV